MQMTIAIATQEDMQILFMQLMLKSSGNRCNIWV